MKTEEEKQNITKKETKIYKPLEFMDKLFKDYSSLFPSQKYESLFESKDSDLIKPEDIIEFSSRNAISNRLKNKEVTSICQRGDHLFVGDSGGVIHLFYYEKEYEKKNFSILTIEEYSKLADKLRRVKCLDVSPSGNFIIGGYANGVCIIWDIVEEKLFYVINDNTERGRPNAIITVKFLNEEEDAKKFEIIKTYGEGEVYKTTLINKKGSIKENNEILYQDNDKPSFINEVFRYKIKSENNNSEIVLAGIGNYYCMNIYLVSPIIQKVVELKHTDDNIEGGSQTNAPDITFGLSEEPPSLIDKIKSKGKKERITVAFYWERVLKILYINIIASKTNFELKVDEKVSYHYLNPKFRIIRVGFLNDSFLYLLDINKKLKIINTTKLLPGSAPPENINSEEEQKYQQCVVGEQKLINNAIYADGYKNQLFLGGTIHSFRGFVFTEGPIIHFFAQGLYFSANILSYENYINKLVGLGNWEKSLQIGIGLWKNEILSLHGVNHNNPESKQMLVLFLKSLIKGYSNYGISQEEIERYTYIVIDFSIHINEINFLLSDILNIYNGIGKTDIFFGQLEPFILNQSLTNIKINENAIISLIISYITTNKKMMLSLLIEKIQDECTKSKTIFSLCQKFQLYEAWFNGTPKEEQLGIIQKMFIAFQEKKHNENEQKTANPEEMVYYNIIKTKGLEHLNQMKEFLGHQILWNVNKLLFSVNYENEEDKEIIGKLYVWLLSADKYTEFCNFDSYSYFEILSQFFLNSFLLTSVQIVDYYSNEMTEFIKKHPPFIKYKNLNYFNAQEVILYLEDAANNISSFYHSIDNQIFFLKLSKLYIGKRNLAFVFYNAAEYLLNIESTIKEQNKNELFDRFACHNYIEFSKNTLQYQLTNEFIDYASMLLQNFITNFPFENFKEDLNKQDDKNDQKDIKKNKEEKGANSLLKAAQNSSFISVQMKLLEREGKYDECIQIILRNSQKFNKEWIFYWVETKLESFQKGDKERFEIFCESVLKILGVLAKLSIEKTRELIPKYFQNVKKITIIRQLTSSKQTQLEFIEKLLYSYIRAATVTLSENEQIDDDEFNDLLNLHIELLISLGFKDKIIFWLKQGLPYPLEDILDNLLKNEVIDAAVHVYQKLGNNDAALNLLLNNLRKIFSEISKENPNYDEFIKCLNKCINICQSSCEQLELINATEAKEILALRKIQNDNEGLWFTLLKKVSSFFDDLKADTEGKYSENFRKDLSKNFQNLFKKMCKYVRVKIIMDKYNGEFKGKIEFTEFKKMLIQMIHSSNIFENILKKGKNVFYSNVLDNYHEMEKANKKGNGYEYSHCKICFKRLDNDEEPVLAFRCGHVIHEKCAFVTKKEEIICTICKRIEMEGITFDEKDSFERKYSKAENEEKEENSLSKKISKNNKIRKLMDYDNNQSDLNKFLEF